MNYSMIHLARNLLAVAYSMILIVIMRIVYPFRLKGSMLQRLSPTSSIYLLGRSKLTIGKWLRLHAGSKIRVVGRGQLTFGANVKVNYNCMFVCMGKMTIEEGVEFGPNVFVYDHDHDFRAAGGLKEGKYNIGEVFIGHDAWVGAGSIILRGVKIGSNSVIAAGSIVSKDVAENSIYYNKANSITKPIQPN